MNTNQTNTSQAGANQSQNSSSTLHQQQKGTQKVSRSKERIVISRKTSGINVSKPNNNNSEYINGEVTGAVLSTSQNDMSEQQVYNSSSKGGRGYSREIPVMDEKTLRDIQSEPNSNEVNESKKQRKQNPPDGSQQQQLIKKQNSANSGNALEKQQSPSKMTKKKEAEAKLIKERLGVENVSDIGEIIIQLQGYTGAAAANASNQEQNPKQQLKFKDLYRNPEVIGQGAYGLVIRVEKNIATPLSRTPPISHNFNQGQSFSNAARNFVESETLEHQQTHFHYSQYVAIKVINKRELNDGGYQVLKNEALILREMDHPNIVKFYDIYETNDFIFIEMEYIPNGTLRNMMQPDASSHTKKRFSDYEASQIIGGLLSAVEHVHSKNYVHRDLKPDNVLIGDPRQSSRETSLFNLEKGAKGIKIEETSDLRRSIKLADFGLSASFRISQAYSLDERMGTLLFMAPEQTKNQNYGKKIDIWAVGIILYLLIEGKHPLFVAGQDTAQTYHEKLVKYNPTLLTSNDSLILSPMARDIFTKLCNPMPIERYTAEQALRHPWITRDFDSPIPQTESQKVREVQAESILRNALNITFFLSVAKLRRNFASVEVKNSQKSTSSSINTARQPDFGLNLSEYMAKCERVIIETEERDKEMRLKRERELQEQLSPIVVVQESEGNQDKSDNQDEIQSQQQTPSPLKADRNTKKKLFDFNSQNLKKNENESIKRGQQQQAATVPATSLNSTSIKRVSTLSKKQSSNQQVVQQQPQIVKRANIHYQQLFADPTPEETGQPGSIISTAQQMIIKRKSQYGEESGPKSSSPPVKRAQQNSSNGKRQKVQGMNQTADSDCEDSKDDQQQQFTQRVGTADDTSKSSPNNIQVKRIQSGINLNNISKPLGNKFHLNLQAIEKPDRRIDQIDRANKTPLELPRKIDGENEEMIDEQDMSNNKQGKKVSKNKKRKLVEASQQQQPAYDPEPLLGLIKSSIEGAINNMGRQSTTDIQKLLLSQQKQRQNIQNGGSQSNGGSSLKKKRTLVATNQQVKPKKMTDLSQIQDSIKFLDGEFDEIQNLSFDQQNSIVQQTGGDLATSFNIDSRQFSNQQTNKAQLKGSLQSKLSKHDPTTNTNQDFSLPQIFNGNNEAITNRRVPQHVQQEDWNYIKNGQYSVQKKQQATTTQQMKGQRSLENSGQRTHNYFFNQPHSLIQNQGYNPLDNLDPNSLSNQQHSFVQGPSSQQQTLIEVRRQSTNYSAIDSSSKQGYSLLHQDQQQFFNAHYNQTQLHPAVANFDFVQFQQKYMQWKEQRASLVAQKSAEDHPSRTVIKQQSTKLNQDSNQQQTLITDSDDFMIMAAKGVASLKQQRSTASVALTSGSNLKTKFNQDSGDIESTNQKAYSMEPQQYQQHTNKTPLIGGAAQVQILPHQIRLEDQLKALIAGNPQTQSSIQPVKIGSKIPMHIKNVQVVKEANIIHANLNQQNYHNSLHQQQQTMNNQPKNHNIVEGQAIGTLQQSPNKRNKKKQVANQDQQASESQPSILKVGNANGDTNNSHQTTTINNPAKIQIVPAKIQVIVQTANNPKQLQMQKKAN